MLPGDGLALQPSGLGRPLRRSLRFVWVVGAVIVDYFSDTIGVRFSIRGGAVAAVSRARYCLL